MLQYDFEQSIGYWVCMTAHVFQRALNEELALHGITFSQWQVLAWLALETELYQTELAERMGIEAPTLAGILDRMQRDGWIERQSCPSDRRKKIVRASARVEPLWAKMVACARRVRARASQGIDPEDFERVRYVLSLMQENLNAESHVGEAV